MSNHQKKAGIAEFFGPLQKRLKLAKERVPENSAMENFIDQISPEVEDTINIINSIENLEEELIGYFGKIERQIDPWIDCKRREKTSDLPQKTTTTEVGESSNRISQMAEDPTTTTEVGESSNRISQMAEDPTVGEIMDWLNISQRRCLKSLGIFPENTELKKILVIYLRETWFWNNRVHLEYLFVDLVEKGILIPVNREHNKVMDRFKINPRFHKWLVSHQRKYGDISSEKREEGIWRLYKENIATSSFTVLLNLNHRYLKSEDIMDIFSKHDELTVVHLGSWRYTQTEVHNKGEKTRARKLALHTDRGSEDHIEVDQTDFLKKLGKNVRYLSLRGISGITELPESIGEVEALRILDLRACYNLEKLPQKPRSKLRWAKPQERWFNLLEVLDISECYLLDHMPKWVCELSYLKVLKGFVVSSLGNKNQPCQLGDLRKLKRLWKLSIRIPNQISGPEVFQGFNSLDSLLVLTITWGKNKSKEIPTYSLPKNLEKIDIRCYTEADLSKLQNPKELKNLKILYIRGGNLRKIPCDDNWKVEILRLRFLKELVQTKWSEVMSSFKNLMYVEYVECLNKPENFPSKDGIRWRKEE